VISASIDVGRDWGRELAAQINADVRDAVVASAEEGAQLAASIASSRSKTGHMAAIEQLPVRGTPDGWAGGFRSPAYYAHFQSAGTLGSRRRKLKASTLRRRESASGAARFAKVSGGAGITPLKFLEAGAAVAKSRLRERVARIAGE
jgi:hypothetical protein